MLTTTRGEPSAASASEPLVGLDADQRRVALDLCSKVGAVTFFFGNRYRHRNRTDFGDLHGLVLPSRSDARSRISAAGHAGEGSNGAILPCRGKRRKVSFPPRKGRYRPLAARRKAANSRTRAYGLPCTGNQYQVRRHPFRRQLWRRRSRCGPLVDLDCAGLDARDQLAAELGRVGNRIEAAHQER